MTTDTLRIILPSNQLLVDPWWDSLLINHVSEHLLLASVSDSVYTMAFLRLSLYQGLLDY